LFAKRAAKVSLLFKNIALPANGILTCPLPALKKQGSGMNFEIKAGLCFSFA
jgi:hypothetical protein